MKIAIDAMGGDHAPEAIVKGAAEGSKAHKAGVILVGDEAQIKKYLPKEENLDITILHTDEFIRMDEAPSAALKKKPNASMVLAARLVRDKKAEAFISAGNTGALMEVSLLQVGRIKGIRRPALATIWPTTHGRTMLLDSGANSDCKAEYLVQFAQMGSLYMEKVLGVESPKVGLINIGEEPKKGNALVLDVYHQLENSDLNFIGNIEPKRFLAGDADVAVCDGFVGNIVLKTGEAIAEFMITHLKDSISKSMVSKVLALGLKPVFKDLKRKLDHSEHGGAFLLGLNGLCIKCHGTANAKTINNAMKMAVKAIENEVIARISDICTASK